MRYIRISGAREGVGGAIDPIFVQIVHIRRRSGTGPGQGGAGYEGGGCYGVRAVGLKVGNRGGRKPVGAVRNRPGRPVRQVVPGLDAEKVGRARVQARENPALLRPRRGGRGDIDRGRERRRVIEIGARERARSVQDFEESVRKISIGAVVARRSPGQRDAPVQDVREGGQVADGGRREKVDGRVASGPDGDGGPVGGFVHGPGAEVISRVRDQTRDHPTVGFNGRYVGRNENMLALRVVSGRRSAPGDGGPCRVVDHELSGRLDRSGGAVVARGYPLQSDLSARPDRQSGEVRDVLRRARIRHAPIDLVVAVVLEKRAGSAARSRPVVERPVQRAVGAHHPHVGRRRFPDGFGIPEGDAVQGCDGGHAGKLDQRARGSEQHAVIEHAVFHDHGGGAVREAEPVGIYVRDVKLLHVDVGARRDDRVIGRAGQHVDDRGINGRSDRLESARAVDDEPRPPGVPGNGGHAEIELLLRVGVVAARDHREVHPVPFRKLGSREERHVELGVGRGDVLVGEVPRPGRDHVPSADRAVQVPLSRTELKHDMFGHRGVRGAPHGRAMHQTLHDSGESRGGRIELIGVLQGQRRAEGPVVAPNLRLARNLVGLIGDHVVGVPIEDGGQGVHEFRVLDHQVDQAAAAERRARGHVVAAGIISEGGIGHHGIGGPAQEDPPADLVSDQHGVGV